ncbi:MAG TPA: AraC family transcriptional regulator [Longimicrobiales bacterium]|nr:AraC family transcriptional regulator [Longimicrobiales bacterium]
MKSPSAQRVVHVSHGAEWSRTYHTPLFHITEARFAPGAVLEPHTHPRPICAIMLAGSFDTRIGQRSVDCARGTVWTEPCEERHRNHTGDAGAHVLVVQPDPHRADVIEPLQPFLEGVHEIPRSGMIGPARNVLHEMNAADALAALSIEGLLLGMLAKAARVTVRRERNGMPPAWLKAARDFVHAEFRRSPRLDDVARAVAIRPGELAVAFRNHYGRSIGAYARDLRFDWAVDRLRRTDDAIAGIAASAGYSDQSHFTRECAARLGASPGRLRQSLRAGP